MIREALEAIGYDPFLFLADGTEQSGRETLARVDVHAERLRSFGAEQGDVLALHGMDRAHTLRLALAAIAEGLVVWPLSYRDPPEVIARQLRRSNARLVVSGAPDCMASRESGEARWTLPGMATLLRTSGSSGPAKLACHTLDSHVASAHAAVKATGFEPGDRWMLSLPLFHVGGLAIVFRALVGRGAVMLPEGGMSTNNALTALLPTHVSLVATQLFRVLASESATEVAKACRCVLVGGGPVPARLRARALDAELPVAVCYGSTETAAFVAATRDPDVVRRPASAGTPLSADSVLVATDGEIHVGGPTLLSGYLRDDGLESALDEDGRYPTGDMGRLDEDGMLYVLGRRDRMFISGGENVQPEEIEAAIEDIAGVEQAVVVDVFEEEFGRRPVAFVHVAEDSNLSSKRLEWELRERLAGFKIPDAFWHLPTSARLAPKPPLAELVAMAADPDGTRLHPL